MPLIRTLEVSPIVLGGNVFGWTAERERSFEILDRYASYGGLMVDTADMYSEWRPGNLGGESEWLIGEWRRSRQSSLLVATKVGKHPAQHDLRRETVIAAAQGSARRLGVDCIDLYYSHEDDLTTPLEETVAAFGELIESGVVRHVAASNYTAGRLAEALDIADRLGVEGFCAVQPHYSLMVRDEYEGDLQQLCKERGLACLPYFPLASGFLTGKYRSRDDLQGSMRASRVADYLTPRGLAILDALDGIAAAHGTAPATVALSWLIAKDTIPIVSASRPDQLDDTLAAASLSLSDAEVALLDAVSS